MSRIVFVEPLLVYEQSFGGLAFAAAKEPPLGLCFLAAVARRNKYDTEIIDMKTSNLSYQKTVDLILGKRPKYVGITSVTSSICSAARLARMIKDQAPEIIIMLGGVHITAVSEDTMNRFPQFDIGVIGEGENAIVNLLNSLEYDRPLKNVSGIIYRHNGKLHFTGEGTPIKNLDELPFPAWDLLADIREYSPGIFNLNRMPSLSIITSRGCVHKCIFCDRSVFGNNYRSHSPEYILEMLKKLYSDYGIRDITFTDDEFMFKKEEKIKLCEMIIKEGLDLTWNCLGRADNIDAELLRLMKKAGCWKVRFGIESGSQKILNKIKKGITLEQVDQAVRLAKRVGVRTGAFFMMALPGETRQTLRDTINFAKKLDLDDIKISFCTPFPGAELTNNIASYGEADLDCKKMHPFKTPTFIPCGLNKEELMFFNKRAYLEFYLRPKIIISYILRIRSPIHINALIRGASSLLRHLLRTN